MKFVFASDSFKGSLSGKEANRMLERAAKEVFGEVECISLPVADGGEGTADALIEATDGERIYAEVHDPCMKPISAYYGKLNEKCAIIEMAAASGLTLIPPEKRNPLYTTSFGTGELILDALEKGFEDIYIAIGGSATSDGGMGCARALGARFLDPAGCELEGTGRDLERVDRIDVTGLDGRLQKCRITVMCDVTNPLCGKEGAVYTFAPQKGATAEMQEVLEKGMCNYREVLRKQFGTDPDEIPGAGAAGGLGAALMLFMKGRMRSGINTVLDLIGFEEVLKEADLVVTGEGRTDHQSSYGKALFGIGERAKAMGVPAVALSGSIGSGASAIYDHGIRSILTTVSEPMLLTEAMSRSRELYYYAALRLFRLIKTGMDIQNSKSEI